MKQNITKYNKFISSNLIGNGVQFFLFNFKTWQPSKDTRDASVICKITWLLTLPPALEEILRNENNSTKA